MFQAWHILAGEKPRPQFFLRDAEGREFGVVEYYSNKRLPAPALVALEFVSADFSAPKPWILFDLDAWKVVEGRSRNMPDGFFESGLAAYLARWPESEKQIRHERSQRAANIEQIRLAEKGFTIAFFEFFPAEMGAEGLPKLRVKDAWLRVEDQYGIRPGEFRDEVTLVLLPESDGAPVALVNWRFGQGFDLLDCQYDEDEIAHAIQEFMAMEGQATHFRDRLVRMRREGVLLGVKPELSVD